MSELPSGWAEACIGDLAELNPKQAFDDELVAGFVPMSHAPTNFRDKLRFDERPWGEIKKAYTNFKDGDVIFAKVTPCFENGKAALVEGLPNGIGAGSSEFFVLRPSCDEVSAKYLLALVKSYGFLREGAENMTGAVGLRRVPKPFVESYPVPVPPAAEQTRIAAKLDELLAQVDTLKARIDGIPVLLKRFRQSVLAAAVSGRLTEEWRGAPVSGYESALLSGLVAEPLRNGKSVKDGGGQRVLRLSALKQSGIDFLESKAGDWSGIDVGRYLVQTGDFLVSRGNGSKDLVGRGGLVSHVAESMAYPDTMIRIRPEAEKLAPKYLAVIWNSQVVRRQIESVARTTAGIWKISQGDLEALQIPLPDSAEQTEIVRRVEQLFAFADQLEAKVNDAKARIDRLTQSILAKAFRGELVPQDPDDEPASVLLARIQAQRTAAPKARRGRRKAENA